MKFELFDDEFDEEKPEYLRQINDFAKIYVARNIRGNFNNFVEKTLVNTRSYYLIITALKVMQNLHKGLDFDMAFVSSLSFMPDQTFVQTMVSIVGKYYAGGVDFAKHFNIDVTEYLKDFDGKYNGLGKKWLNQEFEYEKFAPAIIKQKFSPVKGNKPKKKKVKYSKKNSVKSKNKKA